MANLNVENVRKHSEIKTLKFADPDSTSRKSSNHSGLSRASGDRNKMLSTSTGNDQGGPLPGDIPSPGGNRSSLAGILMMKRKLSQWRANRLFSWNMASSPIKKKPLENTYKLDPDSEKKFCAGKVRAAIEDVLEDMLQNQKGYDAKICSTLSQCISDSIKTRVKSMGYQRYKLVIHVLMTQDLSQGIEEASRCVWDNERDNFATAHYRTGDLVVVANVFGTYFE